jgi:dihydroorotase
MPVSWKKTQNKVAYVNARLLDPASGLDTPGAVLTDGESIADFGPKLFKNGAPEGIRTVDCKGLCLCPGLVDIRVHVREPGQEHKGTMASACHAAIAGGVTSFVCMPDTQPVIDDMSVLEFVARRARLLGLAKVYAYGAITKNLDGKELAEMGLLAESGAVAFTDGVRSVADAQIMRRALAYSSTFPLLIVEHAEEPSLAGSGVMNSGGTATRMGLAGIPREAEIIMVERDIRLAEMTGAKLHFAHISTADSIEAIGRAKERGVQITCDTAPPYFALNELEVIDYRTFAKLSPPLRSESDRQAVVEGLKSGIIDAIASDHAPQDEDAKRLPFSQAAYGGVGLETLLPVTLDLVNNEHLDLLAALRLVTSSPADLMGLEAGRLEKGAAADLILFDPDRVWKVTASSLQSKSKNSPFDERPVQGRVSMTVIDGRTVYEDGH